MNLIIQLQAYLEPYLHGLNFIASATIFISLWVYRPKGGVKRKGITVLSGVLQFLALAIFIEYLTGTYMTSINFLEVGLNMTLAVSLLLARGNLGKLIPKRSKTPPPAHQI